MLSLAAASLRARARAPHRVSLLPPVTLGHRPACVAVCARALPTLTHKRPLSRWRPDRSQITGGRRRMVSTRRRSVSPARSLPETWTEPVTSSQTLGALQFDVAWLKKERDELEDERDTLRAERDALAGKRDALAGERDTLAGERDALARDRDALAGDRDALSESKLDKLYASLQYTLGLVYTVVMTDVAVCKLVLAKLRPDADAASVVVLGVVWACLATLRVWLLLHLAGSLVESIGVPCSACQVGGLCRSTG